MQNLVYEWVDFSKFGQILAKIGSNLRKFGKNLVILFKIGPKIGPIGIWIGYFFLKNWYLYGSTFKFCGGTSLPKPNLSTPPPPGIMTWGEYWLLCESTNRTKCLQQRSQMAAHKPNLACKPFIFGPRSISYYSIQVKWTGPRASVFWILFCFSYRKYNWESWEGVLTCLGIQGCVAQMD